MRIARGFHLPALLAVSVFALSLQPGNGVAAGPNQGDTTADLVFGQGGSFTSSTGNLGGISAESLFAPYGLALDQKGNLYVADHANNRVLEYDSPLTTDLIADRVFGQTGNFSTGDCNKEVISAATLCGPTAVGLDDSGNLYIADTGNHRVLGYATPLATDTIADLVFGQDNSFTSNSLTACFSGGTTSASLCFPTATVADALGNVFIADYHSSRVLEYDSPWTTDTVADRVYGQGGDFTSRGCNSSGLNAGSLCYPRQLGMDNAGNLYVGDTSNHRVLRLDSPLLDSAADYVFGQRGSFTTNTCGLPSTGLITADTLCDPWQPFVDSSGSLFVADIAPSRVLEFKQPLSDWTADRVFGQGSDFRANSCNMEGVNANTLCRPQGVVADPSGNVYVADSTNHRILLYKDPDTSGDEDGDGVPGTVESACGSDPARSSSVPERVDTPTDDDGDTLVNETLVVGAEEFDCDGDGYIGSAETTITTSDQDPCGGSGWPADLVPGGLHPNTLTVQDLGSFLVPVRRYVSRRGEPAFDTRWDLQPDGMIYIRDIGLLAMGTPGHPPMFGGQRAFGRTCPSPP